MCPNQRTEFVCVCIVLQLKNIWDSRSRPVQIKLIMNGSGSGSNLLRVLSIENDILIIEEAGAAGAAEGSDTDFTVCALKIENVTSNVTSKMTRNSI